jgi:hypothetical protein
MGDDPTQPPGPWERRARIATWLFLYGPICLAAVLAVAVAVWKALR